jgi:hypothetical protein
MAWRYYQLKAPKSHAFQGAVSDSSTLSSISFLADKGARRYSIRSRGANETG